MTYGDLSIKQTNIKSPFTIARLPFERITQLKQLWLTQDWR